MYEVPLTLFLVSTRVLFISVVVFIVVKDGSIFGPAVLIVLHQVAKGHNHARHRVLVLNVASGILEHIDFLAGLRFVVYLLIVCAAACQEESIDHLSISGVSLEPVVLQAVLFDSAVRHEDTGTFFGLGVRPHCSTNDPIRLSSGIGVAFNQRLAVHQL